jgi:hypothetical protein
MRPDGELEFLITLLSRFSLLNAGARLIGRRLRLLASAFLG